MNNNITRFKNVILLSATTFGLLCATPFRLFAPPSLCTNTVQNTLDTGAGSLRNAIDTANDGDVITFCPNVTGTITLGSDLVVKKRIAILGPGPGVLTINGNASHVPFQVSSNTVATIAGLTIDNGFGFNGGGIYNDHADLTVSNCNISGCSTFGNGGGGLFNDGSFTKASMKVINCTISGNDARLEGGEGGAIFNATFGGGTGFVAVVNCTLLNNIAISAGGIMNDGFNGNATLSVIGSTFSQNSGRDGGGLLNETVTGNAIATVTSCTFSTNSADNSGGAIAVFGPAPVSNPDDPTITVPGVSVLNSTFIGNSAPSGDTAATYGPTVQFQNSIVNAGSSHANFFTTTGGDVASAGYNLFSDSGLITNVGDQTNTPALLGPLTDNGGPTSTHAPLCGSPAIDAGRNIFAITTDQRGAARTFAFAGHTRPPGGDGTDIGAVESPIWIFNVINTNDSGAGTLRAAISNANASAGIDFVQFSPSAYGKITLLNGELGITDCLFVNGPGATNVVVDGNDASRVFKTSGGIIASLSGLTITRGNTHGSASGAAVYNDSSTLTISNCSVISNAAPSAAAGGIVNMGGVGTATMTILNSTIARNTANEAAGILNNGASTNATLTIFNSTIDENTAVSFAAAIQNTAGGSVTIRNSTISGNSASLSHDAILNSGSLARPAILDVGATIFQVASGTNINNSVGTVNSAGFNLASDNGGGFLTKSTDRTNSDPLLGPLQFNGGQTPTRAPQCGSPAIDGGTNFTHAATDQTGAARTFNDLTVPNAVGGDGTDIGAVERETVCNQPPVALCTNRIVSANSNCVANASVDNGSFDPDSGDSITNRVQTPAGPYSLGTNLVTLTVTDTHGASNSCQATVIVIDTTPPTIQCPGSIVATNDSGQCTATVSFMATASDNCGPAMVSADPESGSTFPKGTNTVTVTAVDQAGNTNTCAFTITVLDKEAPLASCRPAPNPSGKTSPPGKNDAANPNGYYQVLAKDNCDSNPSIYIKDTASPFIAGPFKDGDIVRLKHAGGQPNSSAGTAPIVAVISLKGNGLAIARDADGNTTADAAGCLMAVSAK